MIHNETAVIQERIRAGYVETDTGFSTPCWLWQKCTTKGYAQTTVHGATRRAHRIAYQMFVGPIPDGLVLDHLCRQRACVNPAHLEPVTNRENILRGKLADLSFRRDPITHCPHGHEYTPENSVHSRGKRSCRTCRKLCQRKWRAENPGYSQERHRKLKPHSPSRCALPGGLGA